MKKFKSAHRWHRLRAGAHTMSAWVGDSQLTYLALRNDSGWELTRTVAGAGPHSSERADLNAS